MPRPQKRERERERERAISFINIKRQGGQVIVYKDPMINDTYVSKGLN